MLSPVILLIIVVVIPTLVVLIIYVVIMFVTDYLMTVCWFLKLLNLLMMEKFNKIISWLVGLPTWLRAVVLVLVSALIFCLTLTSCGQTVKVTVRDTSSGVQITTSQDKRDSSATNISINPNIQYYK